MASGPAELALINYIEDALGQSLEEAYPDEWAAAAAGEEQTVTVDLGDDLIRITLGTCVSPDGSYTVALDGNYHFDITSQDFSHPVNNLAFTTGLNSTEVGYAASVTSSHAVHTGYGQSGSIRRAGTQPGGVFKAWRKNPRRILDLEPIVITVPANPSSSNPVKATYKWTSTSPNHGEWARFYSSGYGPNGAESPGGMTYLVSEIGPPVYFGMLLRSDSQVAAGHPLTDWWIASNGIPQDVFNSAGVGMARGIVPGVYSRQAPGLNSNASQGDLDGAFDDFHEDIYADLRSSGNQDSNPGGETISLTTSASFRGWACLFWWHPTEDWYWLAGEITGGSQSLNQIQDLNNEINGGWGEWSTNMPFSRLSMMRTLLPSQPVNEIAEFTHHGRVGSFSTDQPDLPVTHRTPSILGRGPWVRIAPGEPPDDACITSATCVTPPRQV